MAKVTNLKPPKIVIPSWLFKSIASIIMILGKLIGKTFMGIHPDRIKKLMVSTNIIGKKIAKDYPLNFSLQEPIADWYTDCNKKSIGDGCRCFYRWELSNTI